MIVKWKLPSYLRQDQVRVFFSVITSPRDKALFTTVYLYGLEFNRSKQRRHVFLGFDSSPILILISSEKSA